MGLYPKRHENHPSGLPEHPDGNIFYVNYVEGINSIAGGRGKSPEKPFATITYALAQCDDDENDVIYVTSVVQVEAQPIVVNKRGVQIVGFPSNSPGYANQARTWIFPDAHVTGGVFTISAGDVVIDGIMMWSTAGQPCVDFTEEATAVRITIKNCSFHQGSYGIMTGNATAFRANSPSHYLAIIGCHFGPTLTVGGIYFRSNGSWNIIADNFFESIAMPNIDLHINDQSTANRILDNMFMLSADSTVGGAIDIATGHSRTIISGNLAGDASDTALTQCPYRDIDSANAWFRNYIQGQENVENPD